jgi:hypothetical protein
MTECVSLTINYRLRIGRSYMRLFGVYAGTTIPIQVHVYPDGPAASTYTFGAGTDHATLHVSYEDFVDLIKCPIPTPRGEVHQLCFEDGPSPCAVKKYKHCGQVIAFP